MKQQQKWKMEKLVTCLLVLQKEKNLDWRRKKWRNFFRQKNILEDAGHISHQLAVAKAGEEYTKYKEIQRSLEHLSSIKELDEDIKRLKGK